MRKRVSDILELVQSDYRPPAARVGAESALHLEELRFEYATHLRDEITELNWELKEVIEPG